MAARTRRHRTLITAALLALLAAAAVLATPAGVRAADTPRRGGILLAVIAAEPPSQDPNYFKTRVVGSGPFKFKNYTHGSTLEGERNPDYFVKDRPYLDGYRFFISTETSVRAATGSGSSRA